MKPYIVFLVNEFPPGPGGIGAHAYALASFFSGKGAEVNVYTARRVEYESDYSKSEFPFSVSRYESHLNFITKLISNIRYLWRVKSSATHIILSGSSQLLLSSVIRLISRAQIVSIIHGHELLMVRGVKSWLLKRALKASNRVVAVSEFSRQMTLQKGFSISVDVIPNGIHTHQSVIFPRAGISTPLKLITVGSVTLRKGQLNVVRALPSIRKLIGSVKYHVIGIPTMANELEYLAKELCVEDSLVIHGVLSNDQRDQLLQDSDIFMLLSENLSNGDVEGFGIAVLEANLFGLPAIGSKGTGVEQSIHNGVTGFLVDPSSSTQIATSVKAIVDRFPEFSKSSIAWAKEHDWKKIGEVYWKLIEV